MQSFLRNPPSIGSPSRWSSPGELAAKPSHLFSESPFLALPTEKKTARAVYGLFREHAKTLGDSFRHEGRDLRQRLTSVPPPRCRHKLSIAIHSNRPPIYSQGYCE